MGVVVNAVAQEIRGLQFVRFEIAHPVATNLHQFRSMLLGQVAAQLRSRIPLSCSCLAVIVEVMRCHHQFGRRVGADILDDLLVTAVVFTSVNMKDDQIRLFRNERVKHRVHAPG